MKSDIELWRADGESGLNVSGIPGRLIAGPNKLGQRFLLELLTVRGSIKYAPTRGTDFLAIWKTGLTTEAAVFSVFSQAEQQARFNLRAEETDADPADERFRQARLGSVTIDQDTVYLRIQIENMANTVENIVIPIAV